MTPEKIKELRKSLMETQNQFGSRLGIGWLAVHRLEKGTTQARGAVLKILEKTQNDLTKVKASK